jgi:hypothetical protein
MYLRPLVSIYANLTSLLEMVGILANEHAYVDMATQ